MSGHKFNEKKIDKLNNPDRLNILNVSEVCKFFGLDEVRVMVEIGAGTGLFAEAFLYSIPESICYGLDISLAMLDWMSEHRVPRLNGRLEVGLMEESKIPLEDDFADLIFMITVHHELEEPVALLKDAYRVLKPGGKIMIADWRQDARPNDRDHFYEIEEIKLHLQDAGFQEIREFTDSEKLNCIGAVK